MCQHSETSPQFVQLQFTGKSRDSEVNTPEYLAQNLIHITDLMANTETRKSAFDQLHFY